MVSSKSLARRNIFQTNDLAEGIENPGQNVRYVPEYTMKLVHKQNKGDVEHSSLDHNTCKAN